MMLKELLASDPTGTQVTVEYLGEPSAALLFRREDLGDEEIEEELEIWLETAEQEEADDDLVLCGVHPIGDDTQVERLFYFRPSKGDDGPVYSLDVDGTVVPGTLTQFAENFDCFKKP